MVDIELDREKKPAIEKVEGDDEGSTSAEGRDE